MSLLEPVPPVDLQRPLRVLGLRDRLAEDVEDVPPSLTRVTIALKEQGREAGLDVRGRAVRERETVAAVVVRALGRVLATPFLVDQARRRIGKRTNLGIAD